jgi:predicted permease
MIWFLRAASAAVVLTMLCVTGWASLQLPLWQTPRAVVLHPWFIATLFDTYFGFLTFYVWLAYRETAWLARLLWLLAILLLGNIAMSGYIAWVVWRLPADAPLARVLLRPGSQRS